MPDSHSPPRSSPRSGPASPPPRSCGRSRARSATRSRSRRSAARRGAGRRSSRPPTASATRRIELRGIAGEMDLTKVPELSGTRLAGDEEGPRRARHRGHRPRRLLADAREGPGHAREAARRGPALHRPRAARWACKYVRMFGDKIPEGEPQGRGDEARRGRLPADGRVREGRGRDRAHRVARRLHALRPTSSDDPDPRELARSSRSCGTRTTRFVAGKEQPADSYAAPREVDPPHAPQGLEAARATGPALRPHSARARCR